MVPVSGSQSRHTGRAPQYTIALTVAANVNVEVTTTSPGRTPRPSSPRWSAAVPDDRPTAWSTPTRRATSASNASRSGPAGAIQPPRIAARTYSSSSGPTSGKDRSTGAGSGAGVGVGAAVGAGLVVVGAAPVVVGVGPVVVRAVAGGPMGTVVVAVVGFIVLLLVGRHRRDTGCARRARRVRMGRKWWPRRPGGSPPLGRSGTGLRRVRPG